MQHSPYLDKPTGPAPTYIVGPYCQALLDDPAVSYWIKDQIIRLQGMDMSDLDVLFGALRADLRGAGQ